MHATLAPRKPARLDAPMSRNEILRIYLDAPTLARARAGEHNFFHRLIGAVRSRGWRVELRESTLAERLAAPARGGYALFHMEQPTHARALTCRRTYVGAFWHIEAQAERWEWPVAKATFDPDQIDPVASAAFGGLWRKRLYSGGNDVSDGGFVFLPLQGRLTSHRSFQAMSPLDMLHQVLARTDLPVRAFLHPRETYGAAELAALAALTARHPRLTVETGNPRYALQHCRFVVSQNSGLVLEGFVLHKPAVLFGRIDFHHIAGCVPRDGLDPAFAALDRLPEFDKYLYWFLHQQAINAGRPECEDQILTVLRGHGWPI